MDFNPRVSLGTSRGMVTGWWQFYDEVLFGRPSTFLVQGLGGCFGKQLFN